MNWKDAKEQLLKDEKRRAAYNKPDPFYWLHRKWTDVLIWWSLRRKR